MYQATKRDSETTMARVNTMTKVIPLIVAVSKTTDVKVVKKEFEEFEDVEDGVPSVKKSILICVYQRSTLRSIFCSYQHDFTCPQQTERAFRIWQIASGCVLLD